MTLGFVVLGLVLLYLVVTVLSWWVLRVPQRYDDRYTVRTDDGVDLALFRLRGPDATRRPVLLVHGMGVDHRVFDVMKGVSLARFLHARGWDVWLLDLRGVGGSRRRVPRRGGFDDHILHDLPAALAFVRQATRHPTAHLLGYSMGGTVGYGWCARHPHDAGLESFVALGSPWPADLGSEARATMRLARTARWLGVLRLDVFARLGAWFQGWHYYPIWRFLGAPRGTTGPVLRRAMLNASQPICYQVVEGFGRAAEAGEWRSDDGKLSYAEGWSCVALPVRFLTGDHDAVVASECVMGAWRRCGSPDKELTVLGPEAGCPQSYGHVDLAWGRHAGDDVYPRIHDWFKRHDAACGGTQTAS